MSPHLLAGGYTREAGGNAEGVRLFDISPDGGLVDLGTAAICDSPTFLAGRGDVIWTTSETGHAVHTWRWAGQVLEQVGTAPTGGRGPCHLAVIGAQLIASAWGDGVVSIHDLDARGVAGPPRQILQPLARENPTGAHAHGAWLVGDRMLTTDLGTDSIHVHHRSGDSWERAATVDLPEGSGPRHLVHHESGYLYLNTEVSNEILILDPTLRVVAHIEIPSDQVGFPSELAISDDGRALYAAVRGSDLILTFAIEDGGRRLREVAAVPSGGRTPRHFRLVGDFLYAANEGSDTISIFDIADRIPRLRGTVPSPSTNYLLAI